jgi:predicted Rossmann fold nucleotide-binding protein DprA/Smf involved in DNA uptake
MNDDTKKLLNKLTKDELITKIDELNSLVESLNKNRTSKRKQEVLDLLKKNPISIYDMSVELDITNKNVSSQLCYLKKDGYLICTNSSGCKFLEDYDYDSNDEDDSLDEDELLDES